MHGTKRSVSVIVLCHNEVKTIAQCLQSLLHKDNEAHMKELIVVDNGSTDGSLELLESFVNHEKVRLFSVDQMSIGAARRFAVTKAQGPLVAFVDGDCEVSETWLSQHLENLRRVMTVGDIGGVGGPNGLNLGTQFGQNIEAMKKSFFGHGFSAQAWTTHGQREVDHLPTTNAIFYKKALIDVGNFPNENVGEDVLVGKALREKDFKLFLFDQPWVENDCASNLSQWSDRMFRFGQAQGENLFYHRFPFWGGVLFGGFVFSWIFAPLYFWFYNFALVFEALRVSQWNLSLAEGVYKSFLATHFYYTAGVYYGLLQRVHRFMKASEVFSGSFIVRIFYQVREKVRPRTP